MTPLEILEKVNAFYKTAWEHLLIFGAIAGVVIGIVVPVLLQLYQSWQFKRGEKIAEQAIKAQVEQAKSALADAYKQDLKSLRDETEKRVNDALAALRKEYEQKIVSIGQRLDRAQATIHGAVFHVQGMFLSKQSEFSAAADSLLDATLALAEGKDELNLGRCLKVLREQCLPNLDRDHLVELEVDGFSQKVKQLEKKLTALSPTGAYTDRIQALRAAIKEAQSRERKKGA